MNIEKCVFRTQKVKYLSLIIGTDSVCINLIKVQVIQKWSVSKCLRDVLSFLDFVNFYCCFVEDFSKIAELLTELIKKNTLWNWILQCQKAFDKLKKIFIKELILSHFNLNKKCLIECDISDCIISEIFFQQDINDVWRLMIYFSQKMISVKCNYEIYNKELLTIVQIFEKWCSELKDFKYSVQMLSDHKNLKYFKTFKLLNCWQTHWSEYLFRFDFKIVYCFSKLNSTANILSCQSEDFSSKEKNKIMLQQILKLKNFEISDLDLQVSTISDYDSCTFSSENSEISVPDTDEEDSELKDQFTETCTNNEEY